MANDNKPMTMLFTAIVGWATKRGAVNINELPGCWEADMTFDGMPVVISINGHGEDRKSRDGFDVPPIHALVMINGWPAVLCNPYGGTIMGGEPDTEDKLIEAFANADHLPLAKDVGRG